MNNDRREESLTLEILEAIEAQSDVTQRGLARRLGVALGLTNSYLKRCARKGLIKIQQAPANRYLYYLTPKGFAEKSRLTGEYLYYSLAFYRKAGDSISRELVRAKAAGWRRVLLCGTSDIAEIAALRALENDLTVVGVYAPDHAQARFLNLPVFRSLDEAGPFDACCLTDMTDPDAAYRRIAAALGPERVLVPDIIGLRIALAH